jgi:hypothetical protein
MAYYALQLQQQHSQQQERQLDDSCCDDGPHRHDQLSATKIESMFKEFKTHRSAIDFDSQFIKSVLVKQDDEFH